VAGDSSLTGGVSKRGQRGFMRCTISWAVTRPARTSMAGGVEVSDAE
jgi:hypothetical protein